MNNMDAATSTSCTVSVVICTRNRPDSLARCLASVCRQIVRPLEIIVVDDGDLGESQVRMLNQIVTARGIAFRCVRSEYAGLTASRNLGVRMAVGDIVQFLDDDVELDSAFLSEVLRVYAGDPHGALAGVDGQLRDSPPQGRKAKLFRMGYTLAGWWALPPRPRRLPPCPPCLRDPNRAVAELQIAGATMSFRRRLLLKNPFDESLREYALGEDRDMALRMGRMHWIARAVRAHAIHYHDPSGRTDRYVLGRMVILNYWSIVSRHCGRDIGTRVVVLWSYLVLILVRLAFAFGPSRRDHLRETAGMLRGIFDWIRYM